VGSAGRAVADVCELMLDECPVPDALGSSIQEISEQLKVAHEQLQAGFETG
jgi:hypothetical protein